MAGDDPDKILKTLPRILKFALNAEKDTLAGRINLVSLVFVFVLTAALNAGPKLIDQIAQALITLNSGGKELPKPPDFDYGLLWMWLLFMVICMTFTFFSERALQAAVRTSSAGSNDDQPGAPTS